MLTTQEAPSVVGGIVGIYFFFLGGVAVDFWENFAVKIYTV